MHVLYEDNHLLVVDKPAGLLAQPDATGDRSLLDQARRYRQSNENKPGNAFVGLVHRLDRPVSGVVVLARTSKAAARLSDQFRRRLVIKRYVAVVPDETRSRSLPNLLEDHLSKDPATNVVKVADGTDASARLCKTRARIVDRNGRFALVLLEPISGRAHQLRVQLASRSWPIVGDRKYGSKVPFSEGIALHAYSIQLAHPTKKTPMRFVAPLPASWDRFGYRDPSGLDDLGADGFHNASMSASP